MHTCTHTRPGTVERVESGGNVVIESSTSALNVFKMMTELPSEAAQLSRVHFIRSLDNEMSLNVFEYGTQIPFGAGNAAQEAKAKESLMTYCRELQSGKFEGDKMHPEPAEWFEPEAMASYLTQCGSAYVTRSNIRRFCRQRSLFQQVSAKSAHHL